MLSAIAHTALATVAMAGDGDSSHGLPAGEPFGFQVPIAPVVDEQSFALAAWMIWLPVISAVLCGHLRGTWRQEPTPRVDHRRRPRWILRDRGDDRLQT